MENNVTKLNAQHYIPQMVTLREASRRTGFSYDFLRKECLRGHLIYVQVGRGKFLLNLDYLLEQMKTAKGPMRPLGGIE